MLQRCTLHSVCISKCVKFYGKCVRYSNTRPLTTYSNGFKSTHKAASAIFKLTSFCPNKEYRPTPPSWSSYQTKMWAGIIRTPYLWGKRRLCSGWPSTPAIWRSECVPPLVDLLWKKHKYFFSRYKAFACDWKHKCLADLSFGLIFLRLKDAKKSKNTHSLMGDNSRNTAS